MGEVETLIVGGGFYGCFLAAHVKQRLRSVVLLERAPELLTRASFANQARVHQGYHYPRSWLTGLRSRQNYRRFLSDFPECIDSSFEHFYAIGREFSKITARQFEAFCQHIEAPLQPAPRAVARMFDPSRIEAVYRVEEAAFDACRLREVLRARLQASGVEVHTAAEVLALRPRADGSILVQAAAGQWRARSVLLCVYSQLNHLLGLAGLPTLPLQHEITELALVEVPSELRGRGLTVMCGPFFSLMPFPPAGLHSFSHVRYTPHEAWAENAPGPSPQQRLADFPRHSRFEWMRRDAARYWPALQRLQRRESLWEVKTVLPVNASDDGRPILFHTCPQAPALHAVLGGKIDNVYDVLPAVEKALGLQTREVA